jgi:hypothetical protein
VTDRLFKRFTAEAEYVDIVDLGVSDSQRGRPRICPKATQLTYDRQVLCDLPLLYAEGQGTSIENMASEILCLAPDRDPDTSLRIVESHLRRARWLATSGLKHRLDSEMDIPG